MTNNVMMVSSEQQRDSALSEYPFSLKGIRFSSGQYL